MIKVSKNKTSNDVDKYLASVPKQARASLEKLRKGIKATAPKAEEVISYRIPIYKYNGMLVGFAAFKNHCSFMVMSPPLMNEMKEELKKYSTTTGTIHFPFDKPRTYFQMQYSFNDTISINIHNLKNRCGVNLYQIDL